MRRLRIVIGLVVGLCAFVALSSTAMAKEKLMFGEFVASEVGHPITPSTPAKVIENKEDEPAITQLDLGGVRFATVEPSKDKKDKESPCLKPPSVTGLVEEEHSKSLLTDILFRQCQTSVNLGGTNVHSSTFGLQIRFYANESAELAQDAMRIEKTEYTLIHTAGGKCTIAIPEQFIPAAAEEKEEKFYNVAEYTPEKEEPIEKWETSKTLKEEYPGDFKERLTIETTEKFRGIITYVNTTSADTGKHNACYPIKGEEGNKHYETEKDLPGTETPNPWYHWTRYNDGKIGLEAEGLEIKGGQLTFVPPA